jgi:chemotaxis protein MotB
MDHPTIGTTAMRRLASCALTALALLLVPGCVSSARHDEAIARIEKDRARIIAYQNELVQTRAAAAQKTRTLEEALDAETAMSKELKAQLEALGTDTTKLLAEKGVLAVRLETTKAQLAALRRAQQAAEARAALFRDVALKLKRMVDTGQLSVFVRDGRMVIALPTDVLFDTAHVDIKPAGRDGLREVASVLRGLSDRHFQVAGHTDNVPISTARFPSNWELSAGRALEVTRFMIAQGMRPELLSAAGYGEFDPVGNNGTAPGRQKNRRIEITLVPQINELVAVPEGP